MTHHNVTAVGCLTNVGTRVKISAAKTTLPLQFTIGIQFYNPEIVNECVTVITHYMTSFKFCVTGHDKSAIGNRFDRMSIIAVKAAIYFMPLYNRSLCLQHMSSEQRNDQQRY